MEQKVIKLLFALLRSAVCDVEMSQDEKSLCNKETLNAVFNLSKNHDLAHLIEVAVEKNGFSFGGTANNSNTLLAVCRYERINYELNELCEIFENLKVEFMPLKGAVMRKFYSEPWLRTSCDIDVLVKESDVDAVSNELVKKHGYNVQEKGSHDISLFSPGQIHLELHYNLVEDNLIKNSSEVLKNVWKTSVNSEGKSFWKEMSDETFYFYHVAHMAKHLVNGGCGIRAYIDLWILDNIKGVDVERRNELLQKGDLLKFANVSRKLARVWFENEPHDETTKQMEDFVLCGGVYGSMLNQITVQQQKKGGRLKYLFSKIFLPYNTIKYHYPILQKHPILTPVMEVKRWFKLLFCGHFKRVKKEIKYNSQLTPTQSKNAQKFLDDIGL